MQKTLCLGFLVFVFIFDFLFQTLSIQSKKVSKKRAAVLLPKGKNFLKEAAEKRKKMRKNGLLPAERKVWEDDILTNKIIFNLPDRLMGQKSKIQTSMKTKAEDKINVLPFTVLWKRIKSVFAVLLKVSELDIHHTLLKREVILRTNQFLLNGLSLINSNIIVHPIFSMCRDAIYSEVNRDVTRICGWIIAREAYFRELYFKIIDFENYTCIKVFGFKSYIYLGFVNVNEQCTISNSSCGRPVLLALKEANCCDDGFLTDGTKYYTKFVMKPLDNDVTSWAIKLFAYQNFYIHMYNRDFPTFGFDKDNFTLKYFEFPTEETILFNFDNCEYSGPRGECYTLFNVENDLLDVPIGETIKLVIKILSYYDKSLRQNIFYEDFLKSSQPYSTFKYATITDQSLQNKSFLLKPEESNVFLMTYTGKEENHPTDGKTYYKFNGKFFGGKDVLTKSDVAWDSNAVYVDCPESTFNKIQLTHCDDPKVRQIRYSQYYKLKGTCEVQQYSQGETHWLMYQKADKDLISDGSDHNACFAVYREVEDLI
jgi:hypothetical protein